MPTYEYTCRDCGHTFDVVQSMWDESLTMCPECGGSLRKVFAAPAISFKGSGFYATDHGRKKGRAASETSGEAGGDAARGAKDAGAKKEGAGSTSKPETATGSSGTRAPSDREPAAS